jgi:hypothetical protein
MAELRRRALVRHPLLLFAIGAISLGSLAPRCGEAAEVPPAISTRSEGFVVTSYRGGPSAPLILKQAEQLRRQLCETWLGETSAAAWKPRCEIVIHPTQTRYLQAVGRGGGQTTGSSLVESQSGRIVTRRIDLVADARGEFSALAHELTHVILADRFEGRQPPRWLDEGIALMSDSAKKQSLHQRDCRTALNDGTALRLPELLSLDHFTSSHQVAPFYGQSHSLVRYLADRDEPAKVLVFAEAAMEHGYDRALAHHYEIKSVAELERHWRAHASRSHVTPALLTSSAP